MKKDIMFCFTSIINTLQIVLFKVLRD